MSKKPCILVLRFPLPRFWPCRVFSSRVFSRPESDSRPEALASDSW